MLKPILSCFVILIGFYTYYLLRSTGQLRTLINHNIEHCQLLKDNVDHWRGIEDLTIDHESGLAYLSADPRAL